MYTVFDTWITFAVLRFQFQAVSLKIAKEIISSVVYVLWVQVVPISLLVRIEELAVSHVLSC